MARLKYNGVWYRGDSRLVRLMKDLKADLIREDGRLERICEHGVGHTVGRINAARLEDRYTWVHGCDGCCVRYMTQRGKSVGDVEIEDYNKEHGKT